MRDSSGNSEARWPCASAGVEADSHTFAKAPACETDPKLPARSVAKAGQDGHAHGGLLAYSFRQTAGERVVNTKV